MILAAISPHAKWLKHEADPPPPFGSKVKNVRTFFSPLYGLMLRNKDNFTFMHII
jgi:hypothetical protein